MTGYRCEEFFGEGYRDAASVMAYEVFVLNNTDVLDYLIKSKLIGEWMKELLLVYATLMKDGVLIRTGFDTDYEEMLYRYRNNEKDRVEFFEEVLDDIRKATGVNVRFCLWLCDSPQECLDSHNIDQARRLKEFEFNMYDTSDIVLADLGKKGKLYGYEKLPEASCSVQMENNL